ncbi:glycosyltransferase [Flavobacterium sp.]|uniref:glycosyltransferase n=1 Tax=Flavobacterium sp. TaxID=239 RepID=UPI003528407B
MDKKNINIVAISMGSGGTEKTLYLILPLLIKNFNVNLILFNDVRHFAIPKEVNVYLLSKKKKDSFLNKVLSPFKFFFTYKKILNRTKPDISISFLTRPNLLNTFINSCNTRIIISERCFPSIAYKSNSIRYWLYKILLPKYYNKADLLFSNSIYINNDLKQNFGVTIPMKVIYNPIKVNNNDEINSLIQRILI